MSRRAPSTAGKSLEPNPNPNERKRRKTRPAGHPDPDAEVVALRPEDLLATGRYVCSVCGKGFQRDQNLQLHMRTHNVNWELKKTGRTPARRKAYVCPVPSCVYNDRSRALSDITGIKKHFNRKHGTKNLICPRCSKPYAVEADLKAHLKNHALRDYTCHCGTRFTRRNTFEAHRAFCCKLLEAGVRLPAAAAAPAPAGESSSNAARAEVFNNNNFELPDMNEQLAFPEFELITTSYEETAALPPPLPRDEATVEQPVTANPQVSVNDNQLQDAAPPPAPATGHQEQLYHSVAMLPDDPDFVKYIPVSELLKSRTYEELFGAFSSAGIFPAMVPTPQLPTCGADQCSMPPNPSIDEGLGGENGGNDNNGKSSSTVDFFGGSSSSYMEYGAPSAEGSPGLGANLSLSNYFAYGASEENGSLNANSAVNNDFFGMSSSIMPYCSSGSLSASAMSGPNLSLSAPVFDAGKENYYSGDGEPMLESLAFINSNIEQPPHQGSALAESSATALLQKAGLMDAAMSAAPSSTCLIAGQVMSSPNDLGMNLFQFQEEQNPPPANYSTSDFLTLMPNQRSDPSERAASHQQPERRQISDPTRSAFQAYQHHDKNAPTNKATAPSNTFFRDVVKSMDSYSRQKDSDLQWWSSSSKEKAPAFTDFFPTLEPAKEGSNNDMGCPVLGIPVPGAPEPLMAPYSLFSNSAPGAGGMDIGFGGGQIMDSADHGALPVPAEAVAAPPSSLPLMHQIRDGVTMDLLGMGGGGGEGSAHFNEQDQASNMFAETRGYGEDQVDFFFGGAMDGYQRGGFW